MKVFGQLEKAQLENTTSDTASHPKGMITYRTDLNQAKVSNGTTYKLLIDEDSTQTLSNKTYASPITTGAIQGAQIATPANPSAGNNKLYFKADGKLYTLDSSGNEAAVGSGTGGVKNLITNGNADDTASSIFVPYADTGTRPVDGTGGSPTVTTSITTTTPLDGVKSFLLTKPASNVQGQGWAVPFTVDPAYRAKSLKISVDYIVNSGTFVAGGAGVESDVIWYIYDVTNSQLIEPSNIKMFSNSSSLTDKFEATFQSSATGSSYRLIAHVQSTSALAYELKVDNITVSPQSYVFGTPITDWASYTPTVSNMTGTQRTAMWRRVGDSMEIIGAFTSNNTVSGTIAVSLPSGYTIDTAKLYANTATALGNVQAIDATGNIYTGTVFYNNATSVNFIGPNTAGRWGTSIPFTWATADEIGWEFKVPIVGWSSSVQTSDNADTRVVAARYTSSSVAAIPTSETVFAYTVKEIDTHSSYNTSTGVYTVPVAGVYRATQSIITAASTTVNSIIARIRKNGTSVANGLEGRPTANSQQLVAKVEALIECKAGDTIDFIARGAVGGDSFDGVPASNFISIERITGPSAIAASESVNLRYTNEAGTAVTSSLAVIPYASKVYDSHNSFNGSTGVFTAPISGKYRVKVQTRVDLNLGSTSFISAEIRKNGTRIVSSNRSGAGINSAYTNTADTEIDLLAGDTLDVRVACDTATNLTIGSGANHIVISRIGN